MRVIAYVIYAVASTGALVSLGAYIYLMYRGDSRILHSTWHEKLLSGWRKLFLSAAGIAFLVCMYQGAKAMLNWMPGGWGGVDEDGEFRHLSTVIASMFAMGGLAFAQAIDRATHDRFTVREFAERIKGLERLLEASLDERSLASTIARFKERTTELETQLTEHEGGQRNMTSHLQPEGQLIEMYRQLIGLANQHREHLAQTLNRVREVR